MTTSTHAADTSMDGARIDTTRAAMQQALRLIEDEGHKADLLEAASILRAALAEQKCPCGDRPADQCPGEWEPGCDLGANERYVKVAEPERGPGWCDIHQHYKPCEHNTAEQAQPVADAARVIEWATSTPRKAAVHAFTEGPERQAAYWIEWAEARVVNRRLTTEQAQPLSGLDVERLLEDVVGSLPVARKLIRAVEAEVLRRMGVQQ